MAVLVEHTVDGRSHPRLHGVHQLRDLVAHERTGLLGGLDGMDSGERDRQVVLISRTGWAQRRSVDEPEQSHDADLRWVDQVDHDENWKGLRDAELMLRANEAEMVNWLS